MNGIAREDLWGPLERHGSSDPLLHIRDGHEWTTWSWDQWRERAMRFAGGLRELGVQPGERVACMLTNTPASCAAVLGTWLAGGCLVSIPTMARGMSVDAYLGQVRTIVAQASPTVMLVGADYVELFVAGCADVRVRALEKVAGPPIGEPALPGLGEPVFLQYSSGCTTAPRGCVLTAGAIAAQLSMLAQALRIDPERDVSVDWVPLSHDMGLFGCLLMTAYWTGTRLVLGTPQRFLTSPQSWFGDLADFQGTISAGPNFALELAARVATLSRPGPIPLTRLVLGGERVDAGTIERACDALGPARLPRDAVAPAYGMAEAVLAVSATEPGVGPTVLRLDREALAGGQLIATQLGTPSQPATAVVSAGMPLEGISVDVADGRPVGELRVRTPCLADGYLDLAAVSAERFTDDGFLTGDIGFVRDGHVYVTGRADDLLSVAGRNVYARDIESAITTATAARAGCCAVVDIDGVSEPRLVAVLEPAKGHPSFEVMAGAMVEAARAAVGVRLSECVFLPHGQFPKTPTGKVQRFRCRELASDRSFTHAKRVTP